MILLQLMLYCILFTLMVKLAVRGNALNGLYFYPKPVQETAFERGLIDRDVVKKKKRRFMILFFTVMLLALLLIIGSWNGIHTFRPAYLQALLFLEVMNWYDGIVIDKIWVGYSKFWILPEVADIPYIQTWRQVLKKRSILTAIWVFGALIVAGLIVLIY